MRNHEVLSNSQNDSSPSGGNRPSPNQRASYLRCQDTGDTLVNRGASGAFTQDQGFATLQTPARAATDRVFLLDLVTNDVSFRPRTAAGKSWFRDFLSACVANVVFGLKKTARNHASVTTGSWGPTMVDAMGCVTTVKGASKSFEVRGPLIAICWLADNHTDSQGIFEVRIDGALVDTIKTYTGADLAPYGSTLNGLRYGPAARFYETEPGPHTVEIRCISSGSNIYLSYVAGLGDQVSTPHVFLGTGSKLATLPVADTEAYRNIVADLCVWLAGNGLLTHLVDTWAALNPAHFMPDGIHWNAAGQLVVKDCIAVAENSIVERVSWPYVVGGSVFVDLQNGVCISYGETSGN